MSVTEWKHHSAGSKQPQPLWESNSQFVQKEILHTGNFWSKKKKIDGN